jgi:hypothetical protein
MKGDTVGPGRTNCSRSVCSRNSERWSLGGATFRQLDINRREGIFTHICRIVKDDAQAVTRASNKHSVTTLNIR